MVQTSLDAMEDKVRALAKQSAAGMEQTRQASQQALEAVQGVQHEGRVSRQELAAQVDTLKISQSRQEGKVSALQHEVRQVRHDATQMTVATDLTSRTGQAQRSLELEQHMKKQQDYMQDVVQQLRQELKRRSDRDLEKEATIAQLQDTVEKEKQARKSLQEYVEDVQKALFHGSPHPADMDVDKDQKISIDDIHGAHVLPVAQSASYMRQGPPPQVDFVSSLPEMATVPATASVAGPSER